LSIDFPAKVADHHHASKMRPKSHMHYLFANAAVMGEEYYKLYQGRPVSSLLTALAMGNNTKCRLERRVLGVG